MAMHEPNNPFEWSIQDLHFYDQYGYHRWYGRLQDGTFGVIPTSQTHPTQRYIDTEIYNEACERLGDFELDGDYPDDYADGTYKPIYTTGHDSNDE